MVSRRTAVRTGLLVLALAAAAIAVTSQWSQVRDGLGELSAAGVLGAALATFASLGCSFLAWRATLAGLGAPLPVPLAAPIFFIGQLGKYLPGSVWAIVGQMELGKAAGLRRDRVAAAGLLVLVISLAVALALGVLAVPAALESGGSAYAALVLLVIPLAVVLHPRVLDPLLGLAFRLLRRAPLDRHPDGGTIVAVALLSVASNGLLGVAVFALAADVGAGTSRGLPLSVGGYALAAAAGLVLVPLPVGAGVREAVLVLSLAPVLDGGRATLVALLSRVIMTVADLSLAAASSPLARSVRPAEEECAGGGSSRSVSE
jgi:hypothetical protein